MSSATRRLRTFVPFFVAAVLLLPAAPRPALAVEQSTGGDQQAWLLFLQSLASRRTARMCERGLAGYALSFGNLYGKWSLWHHDRIARGEALFRDLLKSETPPAGIDRRMLNYIENTMAELAAPPSASGPLELSDADKSLCAEILSELEAGLKP